MHSAGAVEGAAGEHGAEAGRTDIGHLVEHAAHLLPSQGPITVFVHHNTLHAFEDLPFDRAVLEGGNTYQSQPFLSEDAYRDEVARRRIRAEDLAAVLMDDLGEGAYDFLGFMGTRFHLRLAMLEHPLRAGPEAELRWLIAETDALREFREEASPECRREIVGRTRRWIEREFGGDQAGKGGHRELVETLLKEFGGPGFARWDDRNWQSFALHLLWRVCHAGVHGVRRFGESSPPPVRHRDLLLQSTGRDTDLLVHEAMIRLSAAFLDQGFATWALPSRDLGFFRAALGLYRDAGSVEPWQRGLPAESRRLLRESISPADSIAESLRLLGVPESEWSEFVTQSLLALRGWAGMFWQMETNAEWAPRPSPRGSLEEFLAIRLLLDRLALDHVAREELPAPTSLKGLRSRLRHSIQHPQRVSVDQRAYQIFQLAQFRGWSPVELQRMSKTEWSRLVEEIEAFGGVDRRRIFHLAFERRYRVWTLDALIAHDRRPVVEAPVRPPRPAFQALCCLDEREESFRRHLEELAPNCRTFGVAGFFGAAMYYRGATEARFRPLCPVNVKPRHYVVEEPILTFDGAGRIQAEARRRLGRISHDFHVGTRGFLGGLITGMVGTVASVPLVMRVLAPRLAARIRGLFGQIVTPPLTQLRLERWEAEPGSGEAHLGFSVEEQAAIIGNVLRAIGLTENFAKVVVVLGHGSASLNNPQRAAYDCGACGGASGGPNARAFAAMANDARVRALLAEQGISIPFDTHFVGGLHHTCKDRVYYFDLDRLPAPLRPDLIVARDALARACALNAQERCRRFQSAPLSITPEEALRHVEGRSEDLSQTRPELGHATNAVCVVGRRERTKGLFLDRRAFLVSYDPTTDDDQGSILAGLIRAALPVGAGINLEYYFSRVDPIGYGCGTKLPHNISALLGVMDGACSDLRPGLPWQMVEIHEAMRMLVILETTPRLISDILGREPALERLVSREWVQVAVLDPNSAEVQVYRKGEFVRYVPESTEIPVVRSSREWYGGKRDHLRPATIDPGRAGGTQP